MKKYESPIVNEIKFNIADVLVTSELLPYSSAAYDLADDFGDETGSVAIESWE